MKYDLIVIGAGALGTFHAYFAAKFGQKVLLLDKEPQSLKTDNGFAEQISPSALSEKWSKLGQKSLKALTTLEKEFAFEIERKGSLYLATDKDELGLIEELSEVHQSNGYSNILLSKKEILSRYPYLNSDHVLAGLSYPQEFGIYPKTLPHRMCEYMNENGIVHVKTGKEVAECFEQLKGCTVKTETGCRYEADQVLICCEYTFEKLYPELFKNSGIATQALHEFEIQLPLGLELNEHIFSGLCVRQYESFKACPSYPQIHTPAHYLILEEKGMRLEIKQNGQEALVFVRAFEKSSVKENQERAAFLEQLIRREAKRLLPLEKLKIDKKSISAQMGTPQSVYLKNIDRHIRVIAGIDEKSANLSLVPGLAEESMRQLYGMS
ncbi:FAD-binding oxidoreductase [Marinilongibacter aquaticus]|uniref:FAD-binding oxidoreductase n=1 Tax=Marinilongibacter aquaticus TaxID=2975157 RepID=UPI0021BD87F7|nr:FAD-binding oxidoreductase [Marinilongibacter aquaticus]UBM58106.1 FAD-binding oxidoreductase [Marinilongibacter aquaticus]